jgi:hypothetical protein
MTLPHSVVSVLLGRGVSAEVVARLDDLHRLLGPGAVEAFASVIEDRGRPPDQVEATDLEEIRPRLGRRFLEDHHAGWLASRPSPGFWRHRSAEGAATGVVSPLGLLTEPTTELAREVVEALRDRPRSDSAPPRGVLLLSRNAHLGNQAGSFAIDLVPEELDAALAVNGAVGRHHTIPGSIGEASGRATADGVALLWEIQPNVYKPSSTRSPAARRPYRRYRSWPLTVTVAALAWLRRSGYRTCVVRGTGLAVTHEVDPARPLGPEIAALHDRTVSAAATALGLRLVAARVADLPEGAAELAKLGLSEALEGPDRDDLIWCVEPGFSP